MSKFKKWLVRQFCPTPKSLAKMAAAKFADYVSSREQATVEKVAEWSQKTKQATSLLSTFAGILADGKIEPNEQKAIEAELLPLITLAWTKVLK